MPRVMAKIILHHDVSHFTVCCAADTCPTVLTTIFMNAWSGEARRTDVIQCAVCQHFTRISVDPGTGIVLIALGTSGLTEL